MPPALNELPLNIITCELSRLQPQHSRQLLIALSDLVSYWHQTPSKIVVVFLHKLDEHHHVVDIVEHKSLSILVLALCLKEAEWLITPMAKWIKVMCRVPSVIKTVSIALLA
jgi:hypothetical protein